MQRLAGGLEHHVVFGGPLHDVAILGVGLADASEVAQHRRQLEAGGEVQTVEVDGLAILPGRGLQILHSVVDAGEPGVGLGVVGVDVDGEAGEAHRVLVLVQPQRELGDALVILPGPVGVELSDLGQHVDGAVQLVARQIELFEGFQRVDVPGGVGQHPAEHLLGLGPSIQASEPFGQQAAGLQAALEGLLDLRLQHRQLLAFGGLQPPPKGRRPVEDRAPLFHHAG